MGKKKSRRRGGPRPYYRGKPLWLLLGDLPNHGVGRLIVRGSFPQKEDQPSYMRILEVDMKSKSEQKGKVNKIKIPVSVERIWRGVVFPRPVNIASTSYLSDYILVPKEQEEKYLRNTKTASEKGYYYWTDGQKKRIKKRIEEGMAPYEAKQRELELIAREQAEAAQRNGVKLRPAPIPKLSENNYDDNFDKDYKKLDEIDDSDCIEEKEEHKMSRENRKSDNSQRKSECNELFENKHNIDKDFENFTQEQNERIEKMIQSGMDPDTAKQLEWERQTAFEATAGNDFYEAGPSSGLKRSFSQESNNQGVGAKLARSS